MKNHLKRAAVKYEDPVTLTCTMEHLHFGLLADGEKFIYGVSAILEQIKEGKFSYGNYSQKKIKHQ